MGASVNTSIRGVSIFQSRSDASRERVRRVASGALLGLLTLGLLEVGRSAAVGQEALRASLAGSDAATARTRAITSVGHHNLELGPVMFRFAAGLGTEYNSNVHNRNTNPEDDIIFRPSIGTGMFWPVSDKNMLFINADFGYSAYVNNPELSRLYINPGTEVSFDVYLKDLVINLHVRPTLTQSANQDPTVSGTGDFAQFQNTVGASVLWDMNDLILHFGYDHNNYWGLTSASRDRDGSTDLFYLSAGLRVKPELTVGLDLGAGWIEYTSDRFPDAFQASFGGFTRYTLSDLMNVRLNVGYVVYSPDNTGDFTGLEDTGALYVQLALTHRVNEHLSYVLSGRQGFDISFYGGTFETYGAELGLNWHVLKKITLSTPFRFQHSTPIAAVEPAFIYYGGGIRAGREITEKLDAGVRFSAYVKDSESDVFSYTVFLVGLDLRYRF